MIVGTFESELASIWLHQARFLCTSDSKCLSQHPWGGASYVGFAGSQSGKYVAGREREPCSEFISLAEPRQCEVVARCFPAPLSAPYGHGPLMAMVRISILLVFQRHFSVSLGLRWGVRLGLFMASVFTVVGMDELYGRAVWTNCMGESYDFKSIKSKEVKLIM